MSARGNPFLRNRGQSCNRSFSSSSQSLFFDSFQFTFISHRGSEQRHKGYCSHNFQFPEFTLFFRLMPVTKAQADTSFFIMPSNCLQGASLGRAIEGMPVST